MSWRRTQSAIIGVLLAVLLVGAVIAHYHTLTKPHPGHNDFLTVWEAARSYWRADLNPYGEQATINIQTRIYGRPATDDEFPNYFAYPFYTVFLVLPLVFTSYASAAAIWMVLLEVCLFVGLIALFDVFGWHPKPRLVLVIVFWALFNYYAARGLLLGQVGLVVYVIQVIGLWCLARRHDRLFGVTLALSTIKPQMVFLLMLFFLLWAWRTRRWQIIGSFVAAWSALMLASFALLPSWLGGWIEQVRDYPSYTEIGSPVWIVMQHYLGLGALGEWLLNAALWAIMVWAWYMVLMQGKSERLDWAIMITLTITHLSALRTATPHYVVFVIPMVFYFRALDRRRDGSRWIALILLALLIIPWAQFLLTVDGDVEHPTMYLWLPSGMLALLWVTRRMWWDAGSMIAREGDSGVGATLPSPRRVSKPAPTHNSSSDQLSSVSEDAGEDDDNSD